MAQVQAAAIYARISSDQEGTGLGVARQLKDCHRLAEHLGWTVAGEYVDNDVSAYSGKSRPAYERLLEDLSAQRVDGLLVYHSDRLTRSPKELERFLDVVDSVRLTNVRFVSGDMDLTNGDGLLFLRMQVAFAAHESTAKSRRVKRKLDELAAAGMPHGGSVRPYGYRDDRITIEPTEAEVIRSVMSRFLAGESLRSIALSLNETGVPSVTGAPWRTPSLKGILTSPRIAGLREHRGEIVGPAAWKPIITVEERERVLARFDTLKTSGRRPVRRYLLSGMLRCGRCDNKLFSQAREDTRRYVCMSGPDHGGCGRLTIVAAPVEELVAAAVLHRLDTPQLATALSGKSSKDDDASQLLKAISADREQLDELATLASDRKISTREWMTARSHTENRIRNNERLLARSNATGPIAEMMGRGSSLRTQWPDLTLDRQASIVGLLLDHAVISPGTPGSTSVAAARITPMWRL